MTPRAPRAQAPTASERRQAQTALASLVRRAEWRLARQTGVLLSLPILFGPILLALACSARFEELFPSFTDEEVWGTRLFSGLFCFGLAAAGAATARRLLLVERLVRELRDWPPPAVLVQGRRRMVRNPTLPSRSPVGSFDFLVLRLGDGRTHELQVTEQELNDGLDLAAVAFPATTPEDRRP